MLSFLAHHPPRTKVSHQSTITFDSGASQIEFLPPPSRYLVINRFPPASSQPPPQPNCALQPGPHWHRSQSEEFHVLKGRAYFFIDGVDITAGEGQVVTVPRGKVHWFGNASVEESMEVEFVLDPMSRERDEDFFRNIQTYRDDCRKAGMPRSRYQIWLFQRSADTYPAMPGPEWLAKPLAMLVSFVGGVLIGKWLLGFQEWYPEYSKYADRAKTK